MGAYEVAYWDKIYPGVTVAEINLGNMTVGQAKEEINKRTSEITEWKLTWGTNNWTIAASDIDLAYDPWQTAARAWEVGRSKNLKKDIEAKITAWRKGVEVDPVFGLDENKFTETISEIEAQINIPAKEPEISVAWGRISVSPGENGQEVDERKLMQLVRDEMTEARSEVIAIPVRQLLPKLDQKQIELVKKRAEKLANKKIVLELKDGRESRKWEISGEQMMAWLDPTGATGWKTLEIEDWVGELVAGIDRPVQNASLRFIGEGRVEEFKPAVPGIEVKQEQLVSDVENGLSRVEKWGEIENINILTKVVEPTIKTGEVNALGIKELVGKGTSSFAGSIPNRIFNLQKASTKLDGLLIAPGETFSFNKQVGDVSAATGYKQAYVIKEGRTVLGDGGGLCQVSTTLFRAALNAGLPIEERWAHAYRVHYYEEDGQPGFDATVFSPSVDLKFKNDTPAYLLIQLEIDVAKNKMAFALYGTSDGRTATVSIPRVWDVTPPPPTLYQDDPTLPMGKLVQVDWSAWGAKASFDYKVIRGEEILQQRTFYSNYRPWQAIYLRGTRP